MTGPCDPDPVRPDRFGRTPDRLELLARAATTRRLSRRQLAKLGAGAALGSLLPEWAIFAPVHAYAKTTGSCPPQPKKPCAGVRAEWKPGCKRPVAKGKASEFNGCGPQAGLDLPVLGHGDWVPDRPLELANFFDACKAHDCCYGQCGAEKSTCDSNFLKATMEACVTGQGAVVSALFGGLNVATCLGVAQAYHAAVADTQTGQDAYNAGQAEVCDCCQTYTVQFDSTIDLTPTAGYGWSGNFHLQYTAQATLSTPADGSALASGTATGSYAQATGTYTADDGSTWTITGATGAPFHVVDFDPAGPTITLIAETPRENTTLTSTDYSESFTAPLWAFAFSVLENTGQMGGQVTLALQPGPALSSGEPGVVATGAFDHSGDLGSIDGQEPLDVAGIEHTTITVTAS